MSIATLSKARFTNTLVNDSAGLRHSTAKADQKPLVILAIALLTFALLGHQESIVPEQAAVNQTSTRVSASAPEANINTKPSTPLLSPAGTVEILKERIHQFSLSNFVSVQSVENSDKHALSLRLDLLFGEGESKLSRSGKQALAQLLSDLNSAQAIKINLAARPNTTAEYLHGVSAEMLLQERIKSVERESKAHGANVQVVNPLSIRPTR